MNKTILKPFDSYIWNHLVNPDKEVTFKVINYSPVIIYLQVLLMLDFLY
jgi:hypothetical protein